MGSLGHDFWCAHFSPNPTLWLCLGIAVSFAVPEKISIFNNAGSIAQKSLHTSIMLMGFGIPIRQVFQVGMESFPITLVSVCLSMFVGILLYKKLKLDPETGLLLTVGTTICGGSAIAAVSGAIRANNDTIAKSTVIVFFLNGIALFLFPLLGRLFHMTPDQFGCWSALAIHDTSSVVGAASTFGDASLQTAIMIKLTRSLWILPLTVLISIFRTGQFRSIRIPWFIFGFVVSAATASSLPGFDTLWHFLSNNGKPLFAVSMFLIGTHMNFSKLKQSMGKDLIMASLLWFFVSITSVVCILHFGSV